MNKMIMKLYFYYGGYDKNKMLLLIMSSMYDQYRERSMVRVGSRS
jgi:hypothetical protein